MNTVLNISAYRFVPLPDAAALDPTACYLGFEMAYRCSADKQAILDAIAGGKLTH